MERLDNLLEVIERARGEDVNPDIVGLEPIVGCLLRRQGDNHKLKEAGGHLSFFSPPLYIQFRVYSMAPNSSWILNTFEEMDDRYNKKNISLVTLIILYLYLLAYLSCYQTLRFSKTRSRSYPSQNLLRSSTHLYLLSEFIHSRDMYLVLWN